VAGSGLRLSLPPENRPKQPFTGGPQVIGHTRCHRRTAMGHLVRLIDFQTRLGKCLAQEEKPAKISA
jgi:hypothetical protein